MPTALLQSSISASFSLTSAFSREYSVDFQILPNSFSLNKIAKSRTWHALSLQVVIIIIWIGTDTCGSHHTLPKIVSCDIHFVVAECTLQYRESVYGSNSPHPTVANDPWLTTLLYSLSFSGWLFFSYTDSALHSLIGPILTITHTASPAVLEGAA